MKAERKPPPRTSSIDSKKDDQCYVRNSSFLSRDIEAQKCKEATPKSDSPSANEGPPPTATPLSPPKKGIVTPPIREPLSPPKADAPSPPKVQALPPNVPLQIQKNEVSQQNVSESTVAKIKSSPPKRSSVQTVPVKNGSKSDQNDCVSPRAHSLEQAATTEPSVKNDNEESTKNLAVSAINNCSNTVEIESNTSTKEKNEEWNGVGDKIKQFEKAAEDANRVGRQGSVRGRPRAERLGSEPDDLPPPATPFKDMPFELGAALPAHHAHGNGTNTSNTTLSKKDSPNISAAQGHRGGPDLPSDVERPLRKPEPQKIIKPEFKPMPPPLDVTIRSPSLGAKIPDRFPSRGTAFRNVAAPDAVRSRDDDDVNTPNNFKTTCKTKNKEKYSVSKGSSYFTRGSEEIWLVKKKDIEEIEERVLDSFRRAGGSVCARGDSTRPASDGGHAVPFAHATMGRVKRQVYARSESLDPQWAGARAHTLKRQTSVACTCGHDKKVRAKSAEGAPAAAVRLRSRSHGDDASQGAAHVLDKYETLV